MARAAVLFYGLLAYALFLGALLYAVWFLWTMDSKAPDAPWSWSVLTTRGFAIDAAFLALFAVQHSVMARPEFKRLWTRAIPQTIERSTFVLASALILIGMIRTWTPLPGEAWDARGTALETLLAGSFWIGWALVLVSTFMIDHFELFGLRQVWLYFKGAPPPAAAFETRGLYRFVRHPIMLGFLIAFWSAPHMTGGHLFFALLTSAYILVAIQLEERDLAAAYPGEYPEYRRRVPMLFPLRRSSG